MAPGLVASHMTLAQGASDMGGGQWMDVATAMPIARIGGTDGHVARVEARVDGPQSHVQTISPGPATTTNPGYPSTPPRANEWPSRPVAEGRPTYDELIEQYGGGNGEQTYARADGF